MTIFNDFEVERGSELPRIIQTDAKRLQQVLKNLLSNAFKFTEEGHVSMRVSVAEEGWSHTNGQLMSADSVIAFAIGDSGIGVTPEQQQLIFEAFAQADGGTDRQYGGTGLGLSISREIARLLGGELQVRSKPGEGSTFTLFVPLQAVAPATSGSAFRTALLSTLPAFSTAAL